MVVWKGTPPKVCDECRGKLDKAFCDMRTKHGSWAILCLSCAFYGIGVRKLGTGMGQQYNLQADGSWLKVRGRT